MPSGWMNTLFRYESIKRTNEPNKNTIADFRGTAPVIPMFCQVPALYVCMFTGMEG
jgi:hypothetical protein